MSHPLVVHFRRAKYDVYVGRPGPYGNPFTHKRGTAADIIVPKSEVLPRFREWVLAQPEYVERVRRELAGKVLGCWCAPKACHGDILAEIANPEVQDGS
jgi:hypothetical protein